MVTMTKVTSMQMLSKDEIRLERSRAYILKCFEHPDTMLEPSFQARKDFGPAYGYVDRADWWTAQQMFYPALFVGPDAIELPHGWLEGASETPVAPSKPLNVQDVVNIDFPAPEPSPAPVEASTTVVGSEQDSSVYVWLTEYTGDYPFLVSLKEWVASGKQLTPKQYAAAAKCKAKEPDLAPKQTVPELEDGIYYYENTVYKVIHAKQGSGKQYVKKLDHEGGTFEYVGRKPLYFLFPGHKMSLVQAQEFGKLYGMCCNCGATLTDENSIEAGIGPVCAKKFEW